MNGSPYDNLAQTTAEKTGFPNPATDNFIVSLSLEKLLIKHPSSTFFMQLAGNAWEQIGVFDGDVAIIDKSLEPRPTDIVIWWDIDEFKVSRYTELPPNHPAWGVVISIVHRYRT
ncbi:hypothetical protein KC951_01595 [Candidatus Saccharibacteria bacterium]|nr:hypothetical protein [Candidatus Saccharibacteria bacterium]